MDILKRLPQGALEYVVARSRVVRLARRESLVLGEDLRGILLLVSGRVRVHEPSPVGPDLTFSIVEGGTVVEAARRMTCTLLHNPDARAMLSGLTRRRDAFVAEEARENPL